MEDFQITTIGILCLIFGIYLVRRRYIKLKKLKTNDMLFATNFSIFLDGIMFIALGISCVIFEIIKLLK